MRTFQIFQQLGTSEKYFAYLALCGLNSILGVAKWEKKNGKGNNNQNSHKNKTKKSKVYNMLFTPDRESDQK